MDTKKVNRVEVINHALDHNDEDYGRAYVFWPSNKKINVEVMLQDEGRTLKVFISPK